jgi:rubrerythrin
MRHFNLIRRMAFSLSATMAAVVMVFSAMSTPSLAKGTTLENLMTAYDGESNASTRYTEFAKKAEAEGYMPVASLFRAAAQSEKIHANNHAEVIKKMGGTPKADIQKVDVKSTKENLETALKGETYERDVMYAEFLKQAKAENNKPANRTFNFAKSVEAIHAALYSEALANLAQLKSGQKKQYYVCPECGNVFVTLPSAKCPICFTLKEMFDPVS